MVEVFKTNVNDPEVAESLIEELSLYLPMATINFDLEDCDKILRIQDGSAQVDAEPIIDLVSAKGYFIEVLPDE